MLVEDYLRHYSILDGQGNMDGEMVPMSVAHLACELLMQGKLDLQQISGIVGGDWPQKLIAPDFAVKWPVKRPDKKSLPYLTKFKTVVEYVYNKDYGDERVCECGHRYERHFDSYEEMDPIGCKYCECETFVEKK